MIGITNQVHTVGTGVTRLIVKYCAFVVTRALNMILPMKIVTENAIPVTACPGKRRMNNKRVIVYG